MPYAPRQKPCQNCGAVFLAATPASRFCQMPCYHDWSRKQGGYETEVAICAAEGCGAQFKRRRGAHHYVCSAHRGLFGSHAVGVWKKHKPREHPTAAARLRALVAEQKADAASEGRIWPERDNVSLDSLVGDDPDAATFGASVWADEGYGETKDVGFVVTVRQRGTRGWDQWVDRLLARVDYERLCDEIAAAYEPWRRSVLIPALKGCPPDLRLLDAERDRRASIVRRRAA